MDWKQIQTKWAAMARRIRADVDCGVLEDGTIVQRRVSKSDAGNGLVVKQVVSVGTRANDKRNTATSR